ncbi:MAG: hypothetical protein UZ17_ACD001000179 [Acidobacteria bacterium OLB17]|nr:MAG: hypothetical protein UZ17_ACD001000179 [Acidobacteria bacterium OLB17]MCZ2389653.1 hypothetical protein [Acidobacteriota bacterium]
MKKTIAGLALGLMLMAGNAFAGDGIIIGSTLVEDNGVRTPSTCTSQNGTRDVVVSSATGILISDFTGIIISDLVGILISDRQAPSNCSARDGIILSD